MTPPRLALVLVLWAVAAAWAPAATLDAHGDAGRIRQPRRIGRPSAPAAAPKSLRRVGLDARHGYSPEVFLSDGIFFEDLRALLVARGAALVPLTTFESAALAGLDTVLLSHPHSGSGYTPAEIAALHAFVAAGGRAFVAAEGSTGSEAYVANMNELLAPWGVAYSDTPTDATGHVVTGLVPHAVTAGVASYGIDYQRALVRIAPPALDLSAGTGADDALAVVDAAPGRGCVIVSSDLSSFSDAGSGGDHDLGTNDNARLLGNVFDWLGGQACGAAPIPCDAAAVLAAPPEACEGDLVRLDASASAIPSCGGTVEARWLLDGAAYTTWDAALTRDETAIADGTWGVEIRCDADPACADSAESPMVVEPGDPPPDAPNLLFLGKSGDGVRFTWQDTGSHGHRLRRASAVPFVRAASDVVVTLEGAFEHVEPGEQRRAPDLLFYLVSRTSCAGLD